MKRIGKIQILTSGRLALLRFASAGAASFVSTLRNPEESEPDAEDSDDIEVNVASRVTGLRTRGGLGGDNGG